MKLGRIVLALAFATVWVSGCIRAGNENVSKAPVGKPATTATATPDEFASARVIFAKDCTVCHGDDGTGGLKTVEKEKLKVPSLREGHALKHVDEDFVDQINNGGDGMPKFKDKLSPDEVNTLVRFIRHEFQGK
ncbi:MAG TPA: cytochrome c [Pyrinomonadaceae bacterium]|jgi:mono/diheme cytochrome c family protein|nr:cytochrome c [Pyrinomonadaceae bacterium]